jgi:hypothetical protein
MRALSMKARRCAAVGLSGSLTDRFSRNSTNAPHFHETRPPCFAEVLGLWQVTRSHTVDR